MNKHTVIERLDLEPHIEGGYYRKTYQSLLTIETTGESRPLLSSIYYMLTDDSPTGHFHRNQSDIIHYWHGGEALRYWLIDPQGELSSRMLGPGEKQQLQLLVPGGYWKASELEQGEYGLLSEAVSPGFNYDDMQLATAMQMQADFPALFDQLRRLIKH
jgi:predicted cupin superfamily sugar epimerase